MDPQNRNVWKILNIVAGRYSEIKKFIKLPCLQSEKLFFMSELVYLFENLVAALTKRHKLIFSDNLVQKYDLSSNAISIKNQ